MGIQSCKTHKCVFSGEEIYSYFKEKVIFEIHSTMQTVLLLQMYLLEVVSFYGSF